MKVKKTYTKKMIKGSGIVTDVGGVLLPILGGVAGTVGGTSLGGPIAGAIAGGLGEEGGKALNEWLKSKGLGMGRSLKGNGIASDILAKAKSELAPKIYKGVVSILKNGFDVAKEIDKSGIVNVAQKWLNLFRMGRGTSKMVGSGYSYTPLSVGTKGVQNYQGTTMLPVPTFNSIGQISLTPATKGGKMKGFGNQTQLGFVSSEYGKPNF